MMIKIEKMQSHFSSNAFTDISRRGIFDIYEGKINVSLNTCCKLKLVFLEKCL